MNHSVLFSLLAFGILATAGSAAADWPPPCTCDPMPPCFVLDAEPGLTGCAPSTPSLPEPDVGDLDPRNWPCTCDPVDPIPDPA
jgi:hypothetical protein